MLVVLLVNVCLAIVYRHSIYPLSFVFIAGCYSVIDAFLFSLLCLT